MKKGICQGAFPASFSTDECIEVASEKGFDALELVLEDPDLLTPEVIEGNKTVESIAESVGMGDTREGAFTMKTSERELEFFSNRAEENGIEISSIAGMLHWFYRFTSDKTEHRERALEIGRKLLESAAVLGADTVLIVPGLVAKDCSYKLAYDRAKDNISKLVPLAEKLEVSLAIENVWNKFLLSPLEMKDFVESFNSDFVGVYFDIGNILEYGYPSDWISVLGDDIKKLHCKDYIRSVGNINGFTYLLQGDIDWERVMNSLKKIDYDDYLVVEVPPYPSGPPAKAVTDASKSLDFILS